MLGSQLDPADETALIGLSAGDELVAPAGTDEMLGSQLDPADETALIARLAAIAGGLGRHLVMPPAGPYKYVWREGPATLALVARHLRGEVTIGTELRRADGTTLAACWDADNPADFAGLLVAARQLQAAGARPLLERSPTAGKHAGGGRLWLFFPTPVEAGRAWATAVAQAPALAAVPEFWPTLHLRPEDRGQAVRLPGGFYQREPGAGWCALAEFADAPIWVVGREAAALTLTATTPAGWVTAPAPPPPARDELPAGAPPALDCGLIPPDGAHPPPVAWSDPVWLPKYGAAKEVLPFAITDKEAIAWCNARHDVRTLLPKEANGYARAVWRAERTPSIGYLPNNQWVDFGAGGRRPDGRRDGGDAFEALCRLRGLDRPAALREIVAAMCAEAAAELDAAARAGRGVLGWVAAITAPAGWRRYDRLREASTRGGDGGPM